MISLWEFQKILADLLLEGWDLTDPKNSPYRRQVLYLPTGGGKTRIFTYIADKIISQIGLPVLTIAHRKELIEQAGSTFYELTGSPPDIIMGNYPRRHSSAYKVASIQTLHKRLNRPDKLGLNPSPALVIFDEAHHQPSSSWSEVAAAFPNALHLLVTATPCRTDGRGLDRHADRMVQGPSVRDLEELWYSSAQAQGLVPDTIFPVRLIKDLEKVKKVRGDFDNKPLNELLNTNEACEAIAQCWADNEGALFPTIGFCIPRTKNVEQSMGDRLAEVLRVHGYSAHYIGFETKNRAELLKAYRAGEIQALTNTNLFTEGFDVPNIGTTLLARPTMSLSLYLQMVGRGKRRSAGKDSHFLFDFGQNIGRHGVPNEDREWSLDGVRRKPGSTIVRMADGEILTLEEVDMLDPNFGVALKYEVIADREDFRVRDFTKLFERIKATGETRVNAARGALALWYSQIDYYPTKPEMEAIGRLVVKSQNPNAGREWADSRFTKIRGARDLIDKITTYGDARNAAIYLEKNFTRKVNNGDKIMMPGYVALRQKIGQALT